MDVGTFGVDELAEHAIADHIQRQLFEEVVTTVFQHHTMALGLFGGFHELPTFVNGFGCGYFCGGMFALLHGVNGHWGVQAPRGGDVHQVDVCAFTHGFPAVIAAVLAGFGAPGLFNYCLSFAGAFGIFVAQSHYFHPFDAAHTAYCTGATIAKPNETDAYFIELWCSEATHVELLFARIQYWGISQFVIGCWFGLYQLWQSQRGKPCAPGNVFEEISAIVHVVKVFNS